MGGIENGGWKDFRYYMYFRCSFNFELNAVHQQFRFMILSFISLITCLIIQPLYNKRINRPILSVASCDLISNNDNNLSATVARRRDYNSTVRLWVKLPLNTMRVLIPALIKKPECTSDNSDFAFKTVAVAGPYPHYTYRKPYHRYTIVTPPLQRRSLRCRFIYDPQYTYKIILIMVINIRDDLQK